MKSLEELTAVTISDLTALYPKILTDVEAAARESRFGRPLVKVNTDLQRMKGRVLTVPYRSRIAYQGTTAVGYVAEGTSPTEVRATYTTVNVEVTKIGASFKVTQESIDSVNIDVIKDQILEVGEALADFEDWMIMDVLYGATSATETLVGVGAANGTYTLTNAGLLRVVEARASGTSVGTLLTVSTIYSHATSSGKAYVVENIGTTDTVYFQFIYSARTNLKNKGSSTAGLVYYEDILKGRVESLKLKFKPDIAVIGLNGEENLLKDSRFIDASQYGAREPILNGEIGKAAGLKILTAFHTYPVVLTLDRSRAAWLIVKRNLEMKVKELPEEDSYAHYFYQEIKPVVVNEDAIVVVFCDGDVVNQTIGIL